MLPVLLRIGPWRVFTYGVLIALGGVLSCLIWKAKQERMGLRSDDDFWLLVNVVLFGGFLGGRGLFIVEYVPWHGPDLWAAVSTFGRGFSVLGAFVGVILAVWLMARRRGLEFLRLLDYVGLAAPFWHVFGRLGCFAAGCCFGRPSSLPWAVRFTDRACLVDPALIGVPLHPAQLYEAAGDGAIFLALWRLVLPRVEAGALPYGTVSGLYLAAYGALRFALEFFRGDTVPGIPGLTGGQVLCLVMLASGLSLIASVRRRSFIRP